MRAILLLVFIVLFSIPNVIAVADYYNYDELNSTAYIYKNEQKWLEIKNLGSISDIDKFTETLQVYSNYRYDFSVLDDFGEQYEVRKGKTKTNDLKTLWYSQVQENYNVTVNDYGIDSNWTSKTVYNNQTGPNETIWFWDNKTVVVGNHTENRSRINESLFNPSNKKIEAGQTLIFKKVTTKRAEIGEFSILLKPVFMGTAIKELTWWNGTWLKKRPIFINNTGNATVLTDFQVNLNVTYDSDMKPDFADIRIVNETSGLAEPLWNATIVNNSYADMWFNASNIPGGVWTNSTYYLYYGNASAASSSNGANTFVQWHGAATTNFKDTAVASIPFIYEAKIKTGSNGYQLWGAVNTDGLLGNNPAINRYVQSLSFYREQYFSVKDASAKNELSNGAGSFPDATWERTKIFAVSTTSATNTFTGNSNIVLTSNVPSDVLGLSMRLLDGTGEQEWSFIRKYTSPEPTAQLGAEESQSAAVEPEFYQVIII